MNHRSNPHPAPPPIYPKRYFDKSPTWFAWNRITAADIYALRTERGFQGQNVYFHLNHPIRFVRLVGVVIGLESVANGKYTLLTLDDASGKCIEVKIVRRQTIAAEMEGARIDGDDVLAFPSNTMVDNVDVFFDNMGGLPRVVIDSRVVVEVGMILRIKGTLDSFRNERQIELKLVRTIKDTNEESASWLDTAKWKRDVLSKPWVLTERDMREVDDLIREEDKRERDKQRKKREWAKKYEEKKRAFDDKKKAHNEKKEAKREKQERQFNDGALDGSDVIPAPWS